MKIFLFNHKTVNAMLEALESLLDDCNEALSNGEELDEYSRGVYETCLFLQSPDSYDRPTVDNEN